MTRVKNLQQVKSKRAGLPCPDSTASFWHSQPNVNLLGLRSTEYLPDEADYVIVGSGITGASAAYFLAQDERSKGKSIVMLDAREVCWGATGRNGGHCQPLVFDRTPEIGRFEVKNVETVQSIIKRHDIDCEWRDVVACRTFWDEKLFEEARTAIAHLEKTDPAVGEVVTITNDKGCFEEHRVRTDCVGITLTKGAAQLWPYKYVTSIIEMLVHSGALNVQTNTPVTSIKDHTIISPRGNIKAKNIILATNGYTSHLLEDFTDLIVPVRCEMSALHPTNNSRLPHSYGMVGFAGDNPEYDDYLIQRPFNNGRGGHLMFGGGRASARYNCVGESDDDIVDVGEAEYLRKNLTKMLTIEGDELQASHQWTGIKGFSRDNNPWVGNVGDGIWLCAGYTGHGMPNATLCAKAVVEMSLGGRGKIPACYRITADRIQTARTFPTVEEQDILY